MVVTLCSHFNIGGIAPMLLTQSIYLVMALQPTAHLIGNVPKKPRGRIHEFFNLVKMVMTP